MPIRQRLFFNLFNPLGSNGLFGSLFQSSASSSMSQSTSSSCPPSTITSILTITVRATSLVVSSCIAIGDFKAADLGNFMRLHIELIVSPFQSTGSQPRLPAVRRGIPRENCSTKTLICMQSHICNQRPQVWKSKFRVENCIVTDPLTHIKLLLQTQD